MTKQMAGHSLGAEIAELAEEAVRFGGAQALQIAVARGGVIVWSGAWSNGGVAADVVGEQEMAEFPASGRVPDPSQAHCVSGSTNAQVFHAYSAGKPVLALALAVELERRGIPWSTPVRELLPFLAGEGMSGVTLAHLATHHAGLANAPLPLVEAASRERRVARMASWSPRHAPGERFVYHAESAWWLLAAVLEQLSGESAPRSVALLLRGLGLGERAGLTPDVKWQADIVQPELVGAHGAYLPQDPKSVAFRAAYDAHLLALARPEIRGIGVPGSGYLSTACELALFYQQLLSALAGEHPKLSRACVEGMVQVDKPASLDPGTGAAAMRGRGLVIADDAQRYLRGFPPGVSPQAFGHTGAGGQFGWADPTTGLSFALLCSGLERDPFTMGVRGARIGSAVLNAFTPNT